MLYVVILKRCLDSEEVEEEAVARQEEGVLQEVRIDDTQIINLDHPGKICLWVWTAVNGLKAARAVDSDLLSDRPLLRPVSCIHTISFLWV